MCKFVSYVQFLLVLVLAGQYSILVVLVVGGGS